MKLNSLLLGFVLILLTPVSPILHAQDPCDDFLENRPVQLQCGNDCVLFATNALLEAEIKLPLSIEYALIAQTTNRMKHYFKHGPDFYKTYFQHLDWSVLISGEGSFEKAIDLLAKVGVLTDSDYEEIHKELPQRYLDLVHHLDDFKAAATGRWIMVLRARFFGYLKNEVLNTDSKNIDLPLHELADELIHIQEKYEARAKNNWNKKIAHLKFRRAYLQGHADTSAKQIKDLLDLIKADELPLKFSFVPLTKESFYKDVEAQLDLGRPVWAGSSKDGIAGHATLIEGYLPGSNKQTLVIRDSGVGRKNVPTQEFIKSIVSIVTVDRS